MPPFSPRPDRQPPRHRSTHLGTLLVLLSLGLSSTSCLVGFVAMDVSSKAENRKRKRTILQCREAAPVGHVLGTELPGRDLPAQVFLRLCSRKGEDLRPVPVDLDTFEEFGHSIDYHWARDRNSLVVQDVALLHVDRAVSEPAGFDAITLLRDFALPQRLHWVGVETVFLRAGGSILLRDSGVLRSEADHPFGWLQGADAQAFQPMSERYASDGHNVWYLDQRIDGADAATFEVLTVHFARDRQSVYYAAAKIPGASRDSFRPVTRITGEDRNAAYRIELTASGWQLYCNDAPCHQHERRRTLPGQKVEWSEYDRIVFR